MSYISFNGKPAAEQDSPSLAAQLNLEGAIRFKTMSSGIRLSYEENEGQDVTVWVAERRRTGIDEIPTGAMSLKSRYIPVFGMGVAHA